MIRLDDLEAKANAAIPKRIPAEATIESLEFHQSISPEIVLALIRIARAASKMISDNGHIASRTGDCITAHFVGSECDCGYAELKEALEGVE